MSGAGSGTSSSRGAVRTAWCLAVAGGSAGAALLAAHAALNALLLRVPASAPARVREPVSVLLPVRDEAPHVTACLQAVLASTGVDDLEVLVGDDASSDGTGALARQVAAGDPRVRVLDAAPLAPGWLGKAAVCAQLAAAARGSALVLLDADVRLSPPALAATVGLLREHQLDLASPYPRQVAVGAGERLVQPLLQWSWLSMLPLRLAERSPRPSLSAANGQLLAVDAAALARAGGFAAVRAAVLDDVALVRAVKASGGRGGVVDGTALASCRMYRSWPQLREGYAKSLWAATGTLARAGALAAVLVWLYLLPPAAALAGSPVGLAGYAAGVAGRVVSARRTGGRAWPDALAHPVSVALACRLVVRSWRLHRAGALTWKGRVLPGAGRAT